MRVYTLFAVLLLLVSACGGGNAELQKARDGNAALKKEAQKTAKTVQIADLTFQVAVVKGSYSNKMVKPGQENVPLAKQQVGLGFINKPYGLVELVKPRSASYTASQVEAAARMATGCRATFSMGVLAFVGGAGGSTDLQVLRKKVTSSGNGWRVELAC